MDFSMIFVNLICFSTGFWSSEKGKQGFSPGSLATNHRMKYKETIFSKPHDNVPVSFKKDQILQL